MCARFFHRATRVASEEASLLSKAASDAFPGALPAACHGRAWQRSLARRAIDRKAVLDFAAHLALQKELSFLGVLVIDLLACPSAACCRDYQNFAPCFLS